jgi:hypothetical protein
VEYIIEHSADGRNFNEISKIDPQNGGNTSYSFFDPHAGSKDNFYRIKAERLTGSIEYSDISKVSGINTPMGIYPNPIVNRIFKLEIGSKEPGFYHLKPP